MEFRIQRASGHQTDERCQRQPATAAEAIEHSDHAPAGQDHAETEQQAAEKIAEGRVPVEWRGGIILESRISDEVEQKQADRDEKQLGPEHAGVPEQEHVAQRGDGAKVRAMHDPAGGQAGEK